MVDARCVGEGNRHQFMGISNTKKEPWAPFIDLHTLYNLHWQINEYVGKALQC